MRADLPIGFEAPLTILLGAFFVYRLPWMYSAAGYARRRGFTWSTIAGALLRQPEWWPLFWYPRRFRTAWDVWDRLPRPFRVLRGVITTIVAWMIVVGPFALQFLVAVERTLLLHQPLPPEPRLLIASLLLVVPLVLALLVALGACGRHVLALDLDVYVRRKVSSALMSGPTARRSLWRKTDIAALLAPLGGVAPAPAEPSRPRDFVDSIARAGGAVEEARALAERIGVLDAEIERLAADAEPEEAARLQARLDALGTEADDEGESRRQMRRLLAQQRELLTSVVARLAEAQRERQDAHDSLRALWRRATASTEGDTATATAARPATPRA